MGLSKPYPLQIRCFFGTYHKAQSGKVGDRDCAHPVGWEFGALNKDSLQNECCELWQQIAVVGQASGGEKSNDV